MKHLVFVYGTLKTGYGNNRLLHNSLKVADATTVDPFWLVDCGFPYMLEKHNEGQPKPVMGELWEVDDITLQNLDHLEGVDYNHYKRQKIQTLVDGEGVVEADCYFSCQEQQGLPLCDVQNSSYVWGRNRIREV